MKIKSTLLVATVCLVSIATSSIADNIKVGFNVPLTGFAAADGTSALNGAKLAVEQINTAGGINGDMLELVVYDDQASPKESVPIAQKLIESETLLPRSLAATLGQPAPLLEYSKSQAFHTSRRMPFILTSHVQGITYSAHRTLRSPRIVYTFEVVQILLHLVGFLNFESTAARIRHDFRKHCSLNAVWRR